MGFISDVFDFEGFGLKEMWRKVKKDPERLFLGAADKFGTKLWNKVLDKDWEPITNEWGGQPKDTYKKAEEAGIDTGPGRSMHSLAEMIAASYAGGYGMSKLPAGFQKGIKYGKQFKGAAGKGGAAQGGQADNIQCVTINGETVCGTPEELAAARMAASQQEGSTSIRMGGKGLQSLANEAMARGETKLRQA